MFVFTIVCVYTFPFPLWHVRVLRVILNINQSINQVDRPWNCHVNCEPAVFFLLLLLFFFFLLLLLLGRIAVSFMYVDAAYSYRPSSVVCRSVTLVSPAKTAAPIELLFGLRTWVGLGTTYYMGSRSPMGRGKFMGENGRPIVKYRDTLRSSVQRRLNR